MEYEDVSEPRPPNQRQDAINPVDAYWAIGLFVLAAMSGALVLLFHHIAWPWFAVSFCVGAFAGIIVGVMFGVPLNSTLAAMAVVSGFLEGVYQGWQAYGLLGAVIGGPVGVLSSSVLVILTLMTMSAVVILSGGDPFVNAFPEESSGSDVGRRT